MAVLEGGVSASLMGVGAEAFVGAHVVPGPFPPGSGGVYRLGMSSGVMAASLAANSEIFQFRYVTASSRVALVYGVVFKAAVITMPAVSTTVFADMGEVRMCVARGWTAAGSGGTRATLTGNFAKLRTSFSSTSEVNDAGISSTAALTAGTKTLDTPDIGIVQLATPGVLTAVGMGQSSLCDVVNLLGEFQGMPTHPLVLANQEGFVLRVGTILPATMTWGFTVSMLWAEVNSF